MKISEKYKDLVLSVKCLKEQLDEDACNSNSFMMAEKDEGNKLQMTFHEGEKHAYYQATNRVEKILNETKQS